MSHTATMTEPAGPPEPAHNALEVHNLTKKYGGTLALKEVSFSMPRGSVFGMIGPNGAGKTTTMRTLLDIIRPTSGHAVVLGVDSRHAGPELRRRIGFLPGELILEGRISGRRLLQHYADISGPIAKGRIEELAERLSLDLKRPVRKLSKGNKQKLGIIQAFMHQPDLLVLDEPTSGLDPLMQQEFLNLVKESRDRGQSVFLSSHVISEIQQAADEVAILRDGKIVRIATVEALRNSAIRRVRIVCRDTNAAGVMQQLTMVPGIGALNNGPRNFDPANGSPATGTVEFTATLEGQIQPFVNAISTLELTDLVIEEPDLEEAVLKLYTAPEQETNHD